MPTITVSKKSDSKKIRVEVDREQWEQLASALGFYRPSFLRSLKKAIKESKQGKVRRIKSLSELERH